MYFLYKVEGGICMGLDYLPGILNPEICALLFHIRGSASVETGL